ncbi:hypothetical protein FJT64_014416 [Amphibalanus amphitrite]|uniref:Uncharacterized protein n=2 Tax=Amphibalanus amphitrite TaxID=1232801 RepID=A0A6A4UTQ8_AMPAM|nr:hypothetical protein FJT64_014416 [Amphibalanus amphitrite]
MNISKLGPQLVLVATLLMMLLTVGCSAMPSIPDDHNRACRKASCTYAHLFVPRRCKYDSLVSVYRNGTVDASSREKTQNNLLRFQTDISQTETQEQGKLFIHIYNQRAKRYICFSRSGRVKTRKRLPPSGRGRHSRLTCRFVEQMPRDESGHLYTMYVADEPRRPSRRERVIAFCSGGQASLLRLPSAHRMARRRLRQCDARRRAGRRAARRRHRQKRAAANRQLRRRRQRRQRRAQCQFVFMKQPVSSYRDAVRAL